MIPEFSGHTAAEVNDLRVRAERAEAASAAYKQQAEELQARLETVANGFVAGVDHIDAEHAEKTEVLRYLLAEVLDEFTDDCGPLAGINCYEASVTAAAYEGWLERAKEAGVNISGQETNGDDDDEA